MDDAFYCAQVTGERHLRERRVLLLAKIWLTLATWSKSTLQILQSHFLVDMVVTSGRQGMVWHMFQSFLELFKVIPVLKNANFNHFSMLRSLPKNFDSSLDSHTHTHNFFFHLSFFKPFFSICFQFSKRSLMNIRWENEFGKRL